MGTTFFVALLGLSVGVALYRSRHEEPWKIAVGLVGAFGLVGVLVAALSWAGIDLGRLFLLLAPALVVAFIASFAIAMRVARGRHAAPPPKPAYDLS